MGVMTSFPIPQTYQPSQNYGNHVLIASPSTAMRQRVLESLRSPLRRFEQASGGAEALVHLESGTWQVLFLDRRLPDLDAEELSLTVRQRYPDLEVVLLDEENVSLGDGRVATGAIDRDFPLPATSMRQLVNETLSALAEPPESEIVTPGSAFGMQKNYLPNAIEDGAEAGPVSVNPLPGMIGDSLAMQPVYRLTRLLAARTTTVLITGPTGCGKEMVARAVHQLSSRSNRAFAVVNCAAIPETMLEAELFGYARGAFTGAMQAYAGRIQAAHGGTLFLDEIGEMPLNLQPKLLRFLEQKEVQRLGSSDVVRVDARIVSATNAHLLSLVREGKFREDLYYRLCGFPIEIPGLRDRVEDIAPLAAYFLEKYSDSRNSRLPGPQLSSAALQMLKAQPWPGNIRELQNVIERALILAEGRPVIRPEHLMLAPPASRRLN
jgi:DNA-binding NtrC family response regulator